MKEENDILRVDPDTGKLNNYRHRLIAGAVLLAFFCLWTFMVVSGRTQSLDDKVWASMISLRTPAMNKVLVVITKAGNSKSVIAVMLALLIIPQTRISTGLPAAISSAVSLAIYKVLKVSIARPRPNPAFWLVQEHGFSFPSGHSMNGMLCYGIIIFLLWRSFGDKKPVRVLCAFMAALILCIGFSRMYVGVHYFSDVIGGWTAGLAELMFFSTALDEANRRLASKSKAFMRSSLPGGR
ncbi:MAG: phosphatase PAP2 family protein [Eubacteriales bacterium]|nr:phosphatase PAP2 family protein [Eubacteriales bacterium]